jgi:hypothetical protein
MCIKCLSLSAERVDDEIPACRIQRNPIQNRKKAIGKKQQL